MKLPLFAASLSSSRMSTIIYCGVLVFYGIMIMSAFPSVMETASDPFAENNGATITEKGKIDGVPVYNLTWHTQAGVLTHFALGFSGNISLADLMQGSFDADGMDWDMIEGFLEERPGISGMLSDQGSERPKEPMALDENGTSLLYLGEGTYVRFVNTPGSTIFIAVLVPEDGNLSNATIKGPVMLGNLDVVTGFDEYIKDNPFVEGVMGGAVVDFTHVRGYISLEYFSMWPLFLVIFIAIKTSGIVSKHVEDRSMDILLATGYSRTRFLNEKMLLVLVNLALVLIFAFLGLLLGTIMIRETFPLGGMIFSFLDSIPLALAFIGLSLLVSVLVDEGGKAIGVVMGLVVGEYILLIVANLASWGSTLEWFTLFSYSDPYRAMIDNSLDAVNVIVPLAVAFVSITLSYILFNRKEIHA